MRSELETKGLLRSRQAMVLGFGTFTFAIWGFVRAGHKCSARWPLGWEALVAKSPVLSACPGFAAGRRAVAREAAAGLGGGGVAVQAARPPRPRSPGGLVMMRIVTNIVIRIRIHYAELYISIMYACSANTTIIHTPPASAGPAVVLVCPISRRESSAFPFLPCPPPSLLRCPPCLHGGGRRSRPSPPPSPLRGRSPALASRIRPLPYLPCAQSPH